MDVRTLELSNLHDDTIGPPLNNGRATPSEEAFLARAALEWADTVFVEWCSANAAWVSNNIGRDTRLIVRLHSSELNVLWPGRVAWENVDVAIFVAAHTRDRAVSEFSLDRYPNLRIEVIGNLRELGRFDRAKRAGSERRLGMIGYRNSNKNPRLAVSILKELRRGDPAWELHFLGHPPALNGRLLTEFDRSRHARESAYFASFHEEARSLISSGRIVFHAWTDDVPRWLEDIGFILSCSGYEGTHEAVIEGMASGAVPVVRRWQGAEVMYQDGLLYNQAEDAAAQIRAVAALGDDARRDRRDALKRQARQRFDWPSTLGRLEQAVLDARPEPGRATSTAASRR
jgi:glycosyltransferase involved in cell wall biosynthesis